MTDDLFDPYEILDIPRGAGHREVTVAYRTLARRHHPDLAPGPDAQRRMADLNAAWAVLRDADARRAWDDAHRLDASASHALSRPHVTEVRADDAPDQPVWRRGPNGEGAAGPPPGRPFGSILPFGRHVGWSLGEVMRTDPGYLRWLATRPEGLRYRAEIDELLDRGVEGTSAGAGPTAGRRGMSGRAAEGRPSARGWLRR